MVSWKTPFSRKMDFHSHRHRIVLQLSPLSLLLMAVMCFRTTGSSCPRECTCIWKGGKEAVECPSRGLTSIPKDIDVGTQVLDLTGNNLQSLAKDMFIGAQLLNLQRIYLSNCNIGQIEEGAFARLKNLVELDLSHNLLVGVPSVALQDVPALSRLSLGDNPIQRVENNAFAGVAASLNSLVLSRCQLEVVVPRAFHGLKELRHLKLDNNRLTTLSGKTIHPLKNLHSVDLHGNPWRCDCSMQDVKLWVARSNPPPICAMPERVSGMTLDELDLSDLACEPRGMHLNERLFPATIGSNASLACTVSGNPSPNIVWLRNGLALGNMSRFNQGLQMYVITERGTTEKSSRLTVTGATERDAGIYVCIARNKAGQFSANFSMVLTFRDSEASGLTSGQIAGISVGLVLVGAIVLLLICILLAKWRQLDRESIVKHPPLVMNSVNHVNHTDYKHDKSNHKSSSKLDGGIRMPFSIARLSNSTTSHRTSQYDAGDDAAASEDSDRTLIDTSNPSCDSPSKSSNCTMSTNKPDVVNVVRNNSESTVAAACSRSSKKDKDGRKKEKKGKQRQDKKQNKEKRKDHPPKCRTDEEMDIGVSSDVQQLQQQQHQPTTKDQSTSDIAVDNRCNAAIAVGGARPSCPQYQQNLHKTTLPLSRSQSKEKTTIVDVSRKGSMLGDVDDERYGSYGNLKLSASSEWNKVCAAAETIENAAFDGDVGGLARESYELLEKTWGRGGLLRNNEGLDNAQDAVVAATIKTNSSMVKMDAADTCGGGGGGGNANASSRFRHYVPVLPPLPAQHYSQVRNSLIRTNEDITDM